MTGRGAFIPLRHASEDPGPGRAATPTQRLE
jgi:hypothetical protein